MPLFLTKTGPVGVGGISISGTTGLFAANAPTNNIVDGLILRLDAEDTNSYNGSGTAWNDLSPNAYNGTLVGPTFNATGPKSFTFDGINDYVTFPENFFNQNGGVPFTISVWFKTATAGGLLLGQQASATVNVASDYIPAIYVDTTGKLRTQTFFGGGIYNGSVSTATVNDGLWHNITVTYENATQRSYLDGQLYATLGKSQVTYSTTYYYFLGSGRWAGFDGTGVFNSSPYYTGDIAVFDFYDKRLSDGEVLANYNALLPRYD